MFCAFFFHPASVVSTQSMRLKSIRLKWMDAKSVRKRSSEIVFGAELALINARAQEYGKVESHRIWLYSMSSKTLGCSVDEKRFHQVELKITSQGLEVKQIGFRVV